MRRLALYLLLGFAAGAALGGYAEPRFPTGATPPATCSTGQLFIDTDETVDTNCATTADNSICVCHTTNTWETTE